MAVMSRKQGVEQDSSMPRMNLNAAREPKEEQPPSAAHIPPHTTMLQAIHFPAGSFCMAKLVKYSNCEESISYYAAHLQVQASYQDVTKVEDGTCSPMVSIQYV
jgi:hypothetical protein